MKRMNGWFAAAAAMCCAAGMAQADIVTAQDFEGDPSTFDGWLCNGNQMQFWDEYGAYIGVPYSDFWGVELRNETAGNPALGDLTVWTGGMTYSVDIRVFNLVNFFGDQMNPEWFPVVLEFVDYGNPDDPFDNCSVYKVGPGLGQIEEHWKTFTWEVPDPSQAELPDGWGGTGAEDPNTFEPMLPEGRTYASVMASVDEVRVTTMVPGYFYGANFWEVGFDYVVVQGEVASCPADFDGSGFVDTDDFDAFVGAFEAGDDSADFDGTGFVDTDDFDAFVGAFESGC
jgi:hypothetical protein